MYSDCTEKVLKYNSFKLVFLMLFWFISFMPPDLLFSFLDRFAILANNNLQILKINKSDEGVYRCEGRVEARGEIDFRDIIVIVNGKE